MSEVDQQPPVSPYSIFGWTLFAVGLGLVAWAFTIDPSVSVRDAARLMEMPGGGLPMAETRVNNIGLLMRQALLCICGSGFMVAGAVFACRR
ncbi:hypothetical protein [Phenylobacterium sp.]|uniref:hypothetical protein n=1 Tax=Phenylobacterium sp. TaxID=1871053 RepID=UPI0027308E35|nr:hypothetical protein [Phenylobacterium sp.]MDP1617303.1 hypothetical protein [Phenylobacterium sp.]MDP1985675.1 hypothetical protein [Phenylobacterium sp.]